jgi:hypothetical protein
MPSDLYKFRRAAEQDFEALDNVTAGNAPMQVAGALNFIAFRIGRIDDKLGRLIELMEQRQSDGGGTKRT